MEKERIKQLIKKCEIKEKLTKGDILNITSAGFSIIPKHDAQNFQEETFNAMMEILKNGHQKSEVIVDIFNTFCDVKPCMKDSIYGRQIDGLKNKFFGFDIYLDIPLKLSEPVRLIAGEIKLQKLGKAEQSNELYNELVK